MNLSIHPSIIRQFLRSRIKNQQEYFLHPPFNLEQQLLNAIKNGDSNKGHLYLKQINALKRASLSHSPIRSLKNSLICSCTLFTRAIIEGGVHPEFAFQLSDAYINEIEKITDEEQLNQMEFEMVTDFVQTLKQRSNFLSYSHTINLTISYIHENILQKLPLPEIAEQVHMHPSYLSHRFKSEVGISMRDYINKKRIEESIFFLIHTNITISDIAVLFHFCNQSYYTSLFKKYKAMTPKDYRKLALNE
ncbi:AraC family transcriptional regulator [Longirhabdus pacifica]|uniref:AraC family transcriptional regulator n=1 Tax=Longirhabdus pacifica TaxID=2305227 RepID=UPI0010092458|nr:AraC family transcriptional regulator [Longirhabdus pacifica]